MHALARHYDDVMFTSSHVSRIYHFFAPLSKFFRRHSQRRREIPPLWHRRIRKKPTHLPQMWRESSNKHRRPCSRPRGEEWKVKEEMGFSHRIPPRAFLSFSPRWLDKAPSMSSLPSAPTPLGVASTTQPNGIMYSPTSTAYVALNGGGTAVSSAAAGALSRPSSALARPLDTPGSRAAGGAGNSFGAGSSSSSSSSGGGSVSR